MSWYKRPESEAAEHSRNLICFLTATQVLGTSKSPSELVSEVLTDLDV